MLHPPVHRLFFALRPPEDAGDYLAGHQRDLGPGHEVRVPHLHLTLAITNDFAVFPKREAEVMQRIGGAIVAHSCPVVLDQAVASPRSVMLAPSETLHAVEALHLLLRAGMRAAQARMRTGWRHSPHLTLLYRDGKPFILPVPAFSWRATEFFLVHSLVGLNKHEILARWPLGGPTLH
jgi:2'-5' RNA ligase